MANFLIIGGSSSIGQAVVSQLRAQGHNIFQTARNADKISPDAVLDATDFDSVETVFQSAIAKMGSIDGVLNCAGSLFLKPAHLTNYEQYKATIDASLTTSFAIVRAAGKFMNAGGSVVLISSAAAEVGLANHEAIAAAKAGIIGLMRSAAATYAPQNLRVNVVSPGLTETNLTTQITQNEMSRKISESMHALGRIGVPDDVARACVFLLNPENNWITGQVMNVDGGLAHIRPKMKV
jgi:NAD(P)-dependent dehydrogenase (short-subunit alcohol dehydrogenase family)